MEKYGKTISTSDGEYYLSDLDYSTRECILKSLKKDSYIDIVDMKHRMKLTPMEINFVLYDQKMEQKLYPSMTPSAPYDNDVVESMINRQIQKVSSFNISIRNIDLMMKYHELEEKNIRKNTTNTS